MTETPTEATNAIVLSQDESSALAELSDLGFIAPIASPTRLRAAFAEKQRLYAAVLDESDYIYTVSFQEGGRQQQRIYTRRVDAEKAAKTYGVDFRASPKKSGIVKLASALGITAKRKLVRGLPEDPAATFSYVLYEAAHARTGRVEEGVGWCDKTERGGRISSHDVIATADTRAYNRAILRLAGFGDVSADEIVGTTGGEGGDTHTAEISQVAPVLKAALALPAPTTDDILLAQRNWAEEASKREGLLPEAQQANKAARELRAKARRGDETAARQLGNLGYAWAGTAQDSSGHQSFAVEAPTVTIDHFRAVAAAVGDPAKPGWDASGTGSVHEENRSPTEKTVTREQAAASVPAASMAHSNGRSDAGAETITNAQAKQLSEKLLKAFGAADAEGKLAWTTEGKASAQAWLLKHAGVERSVHVRMNQHEALMKIEVKKEES